MVKVVKLSRVCMEVQGSMCALCFELYTNGHRGLHLVMFHAAMMLMVFRI